MNANDVARLLASMSDDTRALNTPEDLEDMAKAARKAGRPTSGTPPLSLSQRFEALWAGMMGPPYITEHPFHPERKWRFDYAWPDKMVAVEINGGVFGMGRHNRGQGYLDDLEKLNAAAALGWTVFQLGTTQVTLENLEPIYARITGKATPKKRTRAVPARPVERPAARKPAARRDDSSGKNRRVPANQRRARQGRKR